MQFCIYLVVDFGVSREALGTVFYFFTFLSKAGQRTQFCLYCMNEVKNK